MRVTVDHHPTRTAEVLECDAVIYATGFTPMPLDEIVGDLVADGLTPGVDRDYKLQTTHEIPGAIYLQGGTEHTHGLTSSLLSNIAVRSGEIVEAIVRENAPAH